MAFLIGMGPSEAIAGHPNLEVMYAMALPNVGVKRWGDVYSMAVALVTAHMCLLYPPSLAHLDRTPVASVQTAGAPTSYMPINVADRRAFWMQTAPGRQFQNMLDSNPNASLPFCI